MDYIPWVEKYRPDNFNDIVLEDVNKRILTNIIKKMISQIYYFMVHLGQVKRQQL